MPNGTPGGRERAAIGEEEGGCAFILEPAGPSAGARFCNAACRPGSPYCAGHHARCHLAVGSRAERMRLREIEALADAAGGRQAGAARRPPERLLRRFDRLAAALSRPNRSCFVPEGGHVETPE